MSHRHLYNTRLWGLAVLGVGLGVWMSMGCGGGSGSSSNGGNSATMPYSSVSKVTLTGGAKNAGFVHKGKITKFSSKKANGSKSTLKDSFSGAAGTITGSLQSILDTVVLPCEFSFNASSSTSGIDVVDPYGSCTDANKCIVCTTTVDPTTEIQCGISCEGTVPSNAATENDFITIFATYTGEIKTNAPDTTGMVRLDALATNWDEFAFLDNDNNLANVLVTTSGCDGIGTNEVGIADPVYANTLAHQLAFGYPIATLDPVQDTQSSDYEFSTCDLVVQYTAVMPLASTGDHVVNLSRGTLQETLEICDTEGASANDSKCPGASISGGDNVVLHPIGGTVSGLESNKYVKFHINYAGGSQGDVTVNTDGSFQFASPLVSGKEYTVSISDQTAGQYCSITAGAYGTANSDSGASVTVACTYVASMGGDTRDLPSGTSVVVTLTYGDSNLTEDKTISANGSYSFTTELRANTTYAVTVKTQPEGHICAIWGSGSGTTSGPVSDIIVACSHTLSGTIEGLGDGQSIRFTYSGPNDDHIFNGTGDNLDYSFEVIGYGGAYIPPSPGQITYCAFSSSNLPWTYSQTAGDVVCTSEILLFATSTTYNGNLKGSFSTARAGADDKCASEASIIGPLSCTHVRAVISIDSDDEIRDMPIKYDVPTNQRLVTYSNYNTGRYNELMSASWDDFLSSQFFINSWGATFGTASFGFWTGSHNDGSLFTDGVCNGWTDSTSNYNGKLGSIYNNFRTFENSQTGCQNEGSFSVLCICY